MQRHGKNPGSSSVRISTHQEQSSDVHWSDHGEQKSEEVHAWSEQMCIVCEHPGSTPNWGEGPIIIAPAIALRVIVRMAEAEEPEKR